MPAHRLPWIKLWFEALASSKVRQLTDAQYRTWTYAIAAGSQQPTKWRFDSIADVAYVTRRPVQQVKALVSARFLDVRDGGVWIHDAEEYQEVYPSEMLRERSAKATPKALPNGQRTLDEEYVEHSVERSANGAANGTPPLGLARSPGEGDGEGDRDGDRDEEPPTPLGLKPGEIVDQDRYVLGPSNADGDRWPTGRRIEA